MCRLFGEKGEFYLTFFLPIPYKMKNDLIHYHDAFSEDEKAICLKLLEILNQEMPNAESKIWHAHPVWFLDGNPIVGYSKQIKGIRLMFWSGASFEEERLNVVGEKFKDASIFFQHANEIDIVEMKRWITKSKAIQWDYKNLVKRKGKLERLK
jgi:uncharacterized protein YdhG (YjbR/CyaY superfamily)